MKVLILKVVIPLTIIFFSIFTKWWYVDPVNVRNTMMSGFPLIWLSEGWHTSMSLQIFVLELLIDLVVYFLIILTITYLMNRFIVRIRVHKIVTIILILISSLICIGAINIGVMSEQRFVIKRDFDMKVLETGYKFIWENKPSPKHKKLKK